MFFNRNLFNTPIPPWVEKQIGFIVSGPLRQIRTFMEILEGTVEIQQANLVDIVTDGRPDSGTLNALLQDFAADEKGNLSEEDQNRDDQASPEGGPTGRMINPVQKDTENTI